MKLIKQLNHGIDLFKTNTKKTVFVSALIAGLMVSSMNIAQARPGEQAFQKLSNIRTSLALMGYSCRDTVGGGYQQQGQTYTIYRELRAGVSYKLVAAGNVHVKDIDILLHDENHGVIATDTSNDAIPIVDVTPKWTGRFHAAVKMHSGKGYSYLMVCYR